MNPRDRDGTTLGVGQVRPFPTDEATQAAARRTVARLAIRNDPRATNEDLVIATAEVLDALGLLPGVPDRPARRSR
jgi:hypothetical protein